jgi:hypothetical protein
MCRVKAGLAVLIKIGGMVLVHNTWVDLICETGSCHQSLCNVRHLQRQVASNKGGHMRAF